MNSVIVLSHVNEIKISINLLTIFTVARGHETRLMLERRIQESQPEKPVKEGSPIMVAIDKYF